MTGDLTLSIDDDEMRVLGCSDLSPNKYFCLLLGDRLNRLYFILSGPVVSETTHGFLIKVRDGDVCQIGTHIFFGQRPLLYTYRICTPILHIIADIMPGTSTGCDCPFL